MARHASAAMRTTAFRSSPGSFARLRERSGQWVTEIETPPPPADKCTRHRSPQRSEFPILDPMGSTNASLEKYESANLGACEPKGACRTNAAEPGTEKT